MGLRGSPTGWSYAEAGWLNTVNAIGYLIGVLLSLALISSFRMIGPVAAGALADAANSIAPGLIAASVILVLGAVVAVMQRPLMAMGTK